MLVEISGTYKKPIGPPIAGKTEDAPGSRALSVIIAVPEKGNYFLKLTGLDKTVAAQAKAKKRPTKADEQLARHQERFDSFGQRVLLTETLRFGLGEYSLILGILKPCGLSAQFEELRQSV